MPRLGDVSSADPATRPDLRMPALGLAAWAGGLAGGLLPASVVTALVLAATAGLLLAARRATGARRALPTATAALLLLTTVAVAAVVRQQQVAHNPVAQLARAGAVASLEATVTSDPRPIAGRYGEQVLVRLAVRRVTGRGHTHELSTPVLALADADSGWSRVRLGERLETTGRLAAARDADLAAVLHPRGDPVSRASPGPWWRGADAVRGSLRESVQHRPAEQRALVPALVDGDDAGVDEALAADFRVTGLTHLLAVSGTNLTLVVGFLMVVARWAGVRGRWLYAVGALGIVGFVLLARTEPSVLRAAVMGSVALVAMGANGRQRGSRALGVAVVVLLLVQPSLAISVGFALSVLATAGILLLAPGWRDALARWMPLWLAEAVAVPSAAQLACTPLVAAISGQVSLVAVVANLLVAPAVGPATVLGLAGGLLGLAWPAAGTVAGTAAAACVAWIVAVAHRGAALPTAALGWGSGVVPLGVLTLVAVAVALLGPRLLRRRVPTLACCALLVLAVLVRPPTPGWPPADWAFAVCDVGQGDALVLHAGPGAGVVVDAGPDPAAVDRCLRRLEVTSVPLVVLTHFHADHVDGLSGVLRARRVGAVETTRLEDPRAGVAAVAEAARDAGLAPRPAPYGTTRVLGAVTLQVLWPEPDSPTVGPGDGSTANEASVVLLAEVRGVRLLLAGDIEPEGQATLARLLPGLTVDVLKVPHHGSRYQDLDFLRSLRARVALVSVGADNDYGHPSPEALGPLEATGARVLRTDLDGDLVVAVSDGRLRTVTRR